MCYDESSCSDGSCASDLELLAALIYCEAGNQPYEGQVSVGSVMVNAQTLKSDGMY